MPTHLFSEWLSRCRHAHGRRLSYLRVSQWSVSCSSLEGSYIHNIIHFTFLFIVNYNIGNMNPRHIDMEQYWNRENDKLSPARSPSVNSNTNSLRKEDYNQNYCDRLSAGNSPMTPVNEFNGNMPRGQPIDPRYQIPLQIEVGPVSIFSTSF